MQATALRHIHMCSHTHTHTCAGPGARSRPHLSSKQGILIASLASSSLPSWKRRNLQRGRIAQGYTSAVEREVTAVNVARSPSAWRCEWFALWSSVILRLNRLRAM